VNGPESTPRMIRKRSQGDAGSCVDSRPPTRLPGLYWTRSDGSVRQRMTDGTLNVPYTFWPDGERLAS
jgi:hypothetical protein